MCWILLALLLATIAAQMILAQADPQQTQSLGDVARKARAQKAAPVHPKARKVVDEENQVPPGVRSYGSTFCYTVPCAHLDAYLPVETSSLYPTGFLQIPIPSSDGAVLVRFGRGTFTGEADASDALTTAESNYLSGELVQMFGSVGDLIFDEETNVGNQPARFTRFTLMNHGIPHEGMAELVTAPDQVMSLGCFYRKVDSEKGSEICQKILDSAKATIPVDYKVFPPREYVDP
jgi:hypothetical protein